MRAARGSSRPAPLAAALLVLAAAGGAGVASAPAGWTAAAVRAAGQQISLVGTFSINPGRCRPGQAPAGSYLQLQVDGLAIANPSSTCGLLGGEYTPLRQGDQGLVTGTFQPDPVPTFDGAGNSRARSIIQPVAFLTTDLGLATTCGDQARHPNPAGSCSAGIGNPVPALSAEAPGAGGCPATSAQWCLFGDLSALSGSWAGTPIQQLVTGPGTCVVDDGCFDQGAVTGPDLGTSATGCRPLPGTQPCGVTGTFDPATGSYRLDIRSSTPPGAVPGLAGHYVLTGTFSPSPSSGSSGPGVAASGAGGSPGGAVTGGSSSINRSGGPITGGSATPPGGATSPGAPGPDLAGSSPADPSSGSAETLTGNLVLSDASCNGGHLEGSYLMAAFENKALANPASSCLGGTVTLLNPGTAGLSVGHFSPDPVPTFDGHGDSLAGAIIQPATFSKHRFGMATSPQDVQDAPGGASIFPTPEAIVEGRTLLVDLRSLDVTYGGPPGSTCQSSFGQGCWEEGVHAAVGTFDPATGSWSLDWQASQAFVGDAVGVAFHLQGNFVGQRIPAASGAGDGWLPPQYVVVAGSTQSSVEGSKSQPTRGTTPARSGGHASNGATVGSAGLPNVPAHGGLPALGAVAPATRSAWAALIAVIALFATLAIAAATHLGAGSQRKVRRVGRQ